MNTVRIDKKQVKLTAHRGLSGIEIENYLKIVKKYEKHAVLELKSDFTDEKIARLSRDKIDVDVWAKEITREQIEACHKAGLTVNCRTVDAAEDAATLIDRGIDYITTNILE